MKDFLAPSSCILIGGPTASGKSRLALKLAEKWDGEIINTDSMQVYKELPILTACPSFDDYKKIPHHVYQKLDAHQPASAAWWLDQVQPLCHNLLSKGKRPILVGGTGLYFKAFEQGLSCIPAIDPTLRQTLMKRMQIEGLAVLYKELQEKDPYTTIQPQDTQRVIRSLEVILGTDHPLSYWHEVQKTQQLSSFQCYKILVNPSKDLLLKQIQNRWQHMKHQGVITEVKNWLKGEPKEHHALYKAVGVAWIDLFLKNKILESQLDEAFFIATRQYIKRQNTWFRHQFKADQVWDTLII